MSVSFGDVFDAIGRAARPEEAAVICDGAVTSWGAFDRHSNAVARALLATGLKTQDKVALYMRNGPEYLIAFAACFKARLVPVNINFRYGPAEIAYLLDNADARAVIFDPVFRQSLPEADLVRVTTGEPIAGEHAFTSLKAGDAEPLRLPRSGDDIFLLYTGGTTGMPKGVMWPSSALWEALATSRSVDPTKPPPMTVAALEAQITSGLGRVRYAIPPPFMHGTGLFSAMSVLSRAGAVICSRSPSFDPVVTLDAMVAERCDGLIIVGDAFAAPLVRALDAQPLRWDLTSVTSVVSSGMMWSPDLKQGLLRHMPQAVLADGLGASEAASIAIAVTTKDAAAGEAQFALADAIVVDPETLQPLPPGSDIVGVIAKAGPLPLGYYKDPERTARTYVVIDGVRRMIAGDHAMVLADGSIKLLGRGAHCINTAGEKVYPEEVEQALKTHHAVTDALVFGVPDPRYGQQVTAIVSVVGEATATGLIAHVKERLAGYKAPKRIGLVAVVPRGPNGKADYAGAKEAFQALAED